MANICSFSMQVNGKHENIERFYNALTQNGKIWIGRGSEADIRYEDDDERAFIDGWCKWSIHAALVLDAISMRIQQETGKGDWHWGDGLQNVEKFLTIWEACKEFNVNMEVYSEECGCEFQEHYKYENGNVTEECVHYQEICLSYEEEEGLTREGIEAKYNCEISDDEWDEGYKSIGGFEWDFDLEEVA